MQISHETHLIRASHQSRLMNYFFLRGSHGYVLIDSGFSGTARETIIPFLTRQGLKRGDSLELINTHASADHCGGNAQILENFPRTEIIAHADEAGSIGNLETFKKIHRDWALEWGIPYPEIVMGDFRLFQEREVPVGRTVTGTEHIILSPDRKLTLLHAPGHTPGHLIVHDPATGSVFLGDAVMEKGIPSEDGKEIVMPPHYFRTDWYRNTIDMIAGLKPEKLYATHFSLMDGSRVMEFLRLSREFTDTCSAVVREIMFSLKATDTKPIFEKLRTNLGIPGCDNQYRLLVRAHLMELYENGVIYPMVPGKFDRWRLRE